MELLDKDSRKKIDGLEFLKHILVGEAGHPRENHGIKPLRCFVGDGRCECERLGRVPGLCIWYEQSTEHAFHLVTQSSLFLVLAIKW